MNIILFNGPPGSGKDTTASLLSGILSNCAHFKIAAPLKTATLALMNDKNLCWEDWENRKNENVLFNHEYLTYRQLLIRVGEALKSEFSEDLWAQICAQKVISSHYQDGPKFVFVTDLGFDYEIPPFCFIGFPVYVVRLYRDGFTFEGDSRNYISLQLPSVKYIDITVTDGKPHHAAWTIREHLRSDGRL